MLRLCVKLLQSASRMPYYAVRIGRNPGVYKTWDECKTETVQFPKARYKKFDTEAEATEFINSTDKPGWGNKKSASGGGSDSKPAAAQSGSKKDLEVADSKIEVLKEQLAIAKKEKSLIEKEKKLEELKGKEKSSAKESSKSSSGARHSPYPKKAPSSGKTKSLDLSEVRELHTKASGDLDSSSGSTIVYTDGACFNNGAHGASAGIGVYWGPDHPMNTSERLPGRQTNNRAEIHAAIRAIEQAKTFGVKDLTIKTDSNFMIKAMTEWISGWKKKGWITAKKEPVINKEDFQELDQVSEGIKITYVHVPGHKGIVGNEAADKLAVQGAKQPAK